MSLYGKKLKICGVVCGLVMRGSVNGQYKAVFEREFASLEDIEDINWSKPVIEGDCILPDGYGFTVEDISYRSASRSFTVTLKVAEQYLGDVAGFQAQMDELRSQVQEKEAVIQEQAASFQAQVAELEGIVAEQRETIETKEDAIQLQESTIQTQQDTIVAQQQTIAQQSDEIQSQTLSIGNLTSAVVSVAAFSTELPDKLALDMAELAPSCFPTWEDVLKDGQELAAGRVINKDGQLYRVGQSVTPQAHQVPGGEGMLAIYRPVKPQHAGTLEDPIPWVYGMDCTTGLYYSHEGSTYLCKGDMIPCVWAPGTPGLWQWETV